MRFRDDNMGLLLGFFIGGIVGSTGTLLVMKKLGKLENRNAMEHESQTIAEVSKYYENKIEQIKKEKLVEEKDISTAESVIEAAKDEVKEVPIAMNKGRIQYDGLNISKEPEAPTFDYSKISRDKYKDLQKEYEREEIEEEYNELPHQIGKGTYENSTGYAKLELMYYEQNGIFTYMDDTICNNVTEDIIGAENLALFGTDDASIDGLSGMYDLYLRSNKIMTDFHLIYNGTEDYYKVTNTSRD